MSKNQLVSRVLFAPTPFGKYSTLPHVLRYASPSSLCPDVVGHNDQTVAISPQFSRNDDRSQQTVPFQHFLGPSSRRTSLGFAPSGETLQKWNKAATRWDAGIPFACRGLSVFAPVRAENKPSLDIKSDSVEVSDGKTVIATEEKVDSDYWGLVPKKYFKEDGTEWPWHSFRPMDTYHANVNIDLDKHFKPRGIEDRAARLIVKAMRIPADIFFQRRYGCRAMMLETVAAVPGMVAGMLLHLKSLRRFEHSGGWIRALLDEAENERMHLMTFMEVAKPNWYERMLVLAVQGVFFNLYFLVYLLNPRMAHRVVGYLEEEAVHSYTEYLKELDAGRMPNVPAPQIAIDYWRLPQDATLRDVVLVVRADEANHRDVNHFASNVLRDGKQLRQKPAPVDYH